MEEPKFTYTGFQEFLGKHQLMGTRCCSCGALYLPPRALCSACYSSDLEWFQFSGEGKLAGFTSIYVAPSAMLAEGYSRENPYCAGVVRLAEGPAISGQLLGLPCTRPEEIQVGIPLQATFIERGSGENRKTYLAFEQRPIEQTGE